MPEYPPRDFHPRIERLEQKQPLSASPAAALTADPGVGVAPVAPATPGTSVMLADNQTGLYVTSASQPPHFKPSGIKLDRVTNPRVVNGVSNASLTPPYGHVLVQRQLPVPGQTYNLLFLSVYNATGKTITASDNYTVRTTNTAKGISFPILQGNQVWPAGGRIVFYLMTNSYYTLNPSQTAGFTFNFLDPSTPLVNAIPGPSGIALRIKYNPATIDKVLDYYVTSGPGAIGHQFGIPDTAIFNIFPKSVKAVHL
jgi:hypothetical protein